MQDKVAEIIKARITSSKKSLQATLILVGLAVIFTYKDLRDDSPILVAFFIVLLVAVLVLPQIINVVMNNRNYPQPSMSYRTYNRLVYIKALRGKKLFNKIDLGMQTANAADELTNMYPDKASLSYSLIMIPLDALDLATDSRLDQSRAEGLVIEKYFLMKEKDPTSVLDHQSIYPNASSDLR